MIDVKQILSEFKSFFENLINIRALNGRIVESNSYSYTPELLTKDDFGLIFASIMKWLFPNQDVGLRPYIDPFANTSKRAIYKKGVSKIVLKGSLGI